MNKDWYCKIFGLVIIAIFLIFLIFNIFFATKTISEEIPFEKINNADELVAYLNSDKQPLDTSNWLTYTDTKSGLMFKYPQNWTVSEKELPRSHFQVAPKLDYSIVIEPKDNRMEDPESGWCTLQFFPANEADILVWLSKNNFYGWPDSLITLQSYYRKTFGNIRGSLVIEGGPNVTITSSFFTYLHPQGQIARFGYWGGGDVDHQDYFKQYSATCRAIMFSLNRQEL